MSEREGRASEEERTEETSATQEALTETTADAHKKRVRPSALELLFQEAEVIARNLKESGTRR